MQKIKKSKVLAVFLGTIVEFYDYSLYGFSAGIIVEKFFLNSDYLTSLANVFAIYYIGYLSKPLGSLIFGRIGDYYGRRAALSTTIIGIAIPTVIIGLLPDYSIIEGWSILILIICRFLQGIFVAGEYDGAAIYVIEHLGKKFQFTASAITRATGVIGLLLGIGATNFFNAHIFPDWGWRVPFLLSLPLALVTLYCRQKLDETPDFKEMQARSIEIKGIMNLLRKQWQSLLIVVLFAGGFGVTYQVTIIFMKQYLPIVLPQTHLIISTFSVLMVVCFGVAMPIAGLIADNIGVTKVLKTSLGGTILACLLLAIAIQHEMINLALVSCLMLAVFIAPFNALAHGIMVKAFSVNQRYRAVSLGHTIGSMLMSGSANYICLVSMKLLKFNLFPVLYIGFFAIVSYLIASFFEQRFSNGN